ncbi:hypothetical protein pb186bvf_016508 [Paramecium bursaria]
MAGIIFLHSIILWQSYIYQILKLILQKKTRYIIGVKVQEQKQGIHENKQNSYSNFD